MIMKHFQSIADLGSKPAISKSSTAKEFNLSRQSLYYHPKLPAKDFELKQRIVEVMTDNKSYGYRRIAIALAINPKRVFRVMRLFGLKVKKPPSKPKFNYQKKSEDNKLVRKNLIADFNLSQPNQVWSSDFTYIKFQQKFLYLATILDTYTREIVAWQLSSRHNTELITQTLTIALNKRNWAPTIFHSDQGSEYCSNQMQELLKKYGIQISMSKKASPWENGKQESFYQKFKLELKHPETYNGHGELMEAIALQIHYYNQKRIHSALKMPPAVFYQKCCDLNQKAVIC
jgi:transposase InsO family protein